MMKVLCRTSRRYSFVFGSNLAGQHGSGAARVTVSTSEQLKVWVVAGLVKALQFQL